MGDLEHAFVENLALIPRRSTDDHLDHAVLGRGAAQSSRSPLDFGARAMVGNVLGEPLSDAGLDRAHSLRPPHLDVFF
jgi:hypothetical protein